MSRIVPGRKYGERDFKALLDQKTANDLIFKGYVIQHDRKDNTYSVVHWTKNTGERLETRVDDPYAFADTPLIQKRTPAQRKDSLIQKWWEDCKEAGTVPGLSDEQVTAIIGQEWKTGQTEMTGEVVERLAAAMLGQAETKFEIDEGKKIVRTAPSD